MSKRPGDPGWCIHYRSMSQFDSCKAGVAFDKWKDVTFAERPCFLTKEGESQTEARPCVHLRHPTPEEIAAHKKWIDERHSILFTVLAGIRDWRERHKGKSASEAVECPACKGRLHLSISGYNGHVHGKCETKGCVSWME